MQGQVSAISTGVIQGITQASSPLEVVEWGANHRVWQWKTFDHGSNGKVTPRIHKVTELAVGMHYQDANGQWQESKEQIDILPDGTAAAINGRHQAFFPGDIYEGAITVVTPDQQTLQSRPLLLCYVDGANIVTIGEIKSSAGELLTSNQVIYQDAFTGIKADLRYTYTKGGFEQDVVLRQQPPSPASLGLNPQTTCIEVFTEFLNAPEPVMNSGTADKANSLQDTNLKFGSMKMVLGKAFSTSDANKKTVEGTTVFKDWVTVQGRKFLVEKLPYKNIVQQLQKLPLQASVIKPDSSIKLAMSRSVPALPSPRSIRASTNAVLLAKADFNENPGVVLDYVILGGVITNNFTFQADTTYLMTGSSYFEIDGLVTFEGGAVIKFATNTAGFQLFYGGVSCQTSPYRPVILTALDDDTVGENIPGSTGNPAGYYGNGITLYNNNGLILHDIRMSYLNAGIGTYTTLELDGFQAINCSTPISHAWAGVTVNNGLFYNIGNVAIQSVGTPTAVSGTHLTIDNCNTFADSTTPALTLVNSLVTATTNLLAGTGALTTNNVVRLASNSGVYQVVGGGSHYLATNSPYRDAGTTNINSTALAKVKQATTYPPIVFSSATFTTITNLSPQAQRDTNTPDLGYHYDPLDYVFGGCDLYTNLTLNAGTAIGWYQGYGSVYSSGQPY